MRRRNPSTLCRCGHAFVAHEHLRRGTDCSLCTAELCPAFRADTRSKLLGRLVTRLRGRGNVSPRDSGPSDRFRPIVVRNS